MTTVPGTYFTKEQLEAALKVDKVPVAVGTDSSRMQYFGVVYDFEKKQYDKALAWYLLAAMENNSSAQHSIGTSYFYGQGVPKNYLCALKWYLKSAEQNGYENTSINIGNLFEYGHGIPLDKHKALEWYCQEKDKTYRDGLNIKGYHQSEADIKKSRQQLIKESEAILDSEKKKLEEKQDKTQQEMETLVDLSITCKLTGGGKEAWKDVPILLAGHDTKYIDDMKKQIQMLSQENSTFKDQTMELQSLKQEKANFELEIKGKDEKINSLENENLTYRTSSIQQTQALNSLKQEKQTMEQDKMNITNEMERLKSSYTILEQQQQQQTVNSRETRPSSSTTLPEVNISSNATVPESTTSNAGITKDDPNNDFNYDTECGAEYSSSDDTSSEDGDHANDLNYDSDV